MTYTPLPTTHLDKNAGLLRPACVLPERVGLDNPALDVMTDFRRLTAFIATPGDTIVRDQLVLDVPGKLANLVV